MPSLRALPSRLRFAALQDFLHSEAAGGAVLMLSAAAALVWANSAGGGLYRSLLNAPLLHETPLIWINDGLMAVFFLLVGLEMQARGHRGRAGFAPGRTRRLARNRGSGRDGRAGADPTWLVNWRLLARDPAGLGDPHRHRYRLRAGGILALLGSACARSRLKVFLTALGHHRRSRRGADHRRLLHQGAEPVAPESGRCGRSSSRPRCSGLNRAGVSRLSPYLVLGGAVALVPRAEIGHPCHHRRVWLLALHHSLCA